MRDSHGKIAWTFTHYCLIGLSDGRIVLETECLHKAGSALECGIGIGYGNTKAGAYWHAQEHYLNSKRRGNAA